MVTFGGLSRSPKVITVLQRRALAMNPRYIFVVSYQISSNMVASATAPLRWRVLVSLCPLSFCFAFWSLQDFSLVREILDHEVPPPSRVLSCLHPKLFPL